MSIETILYMALHGVTTIGAIIVFIIKIEHRLTKLETKMEQVEKKLPC